MNAKKQMELFPQMILESINPSYSSHGPYSKEQRLIALRWGLPAKTAASLKLWDGRSKPEIESESVHQRKSSVGKGEDRAHLLFHKCTIERKKGKK